MTALRELAERWKAEADIATGDGNMFNGGLIMTKQQCADELLSILDAEGDGGAVIGWVFQHDETGRMAFCENDGVNNPENFAANNPRHVLCGPAYTHPARSGVVSDADVEAACRVNYESDGNSKWDKLAECWKVKHRTAMRAALEHFAKGERHER